MSYSRQGPRQAPYTPPPPPDPTPPLCCGTPCGDCTTDEDERLGLWRWICLRCGRQQEGQAPGPDPAEDPEPCPHAAGSPGKILAMTRREGEGYALFSAADSAEQVSPVPPSSSHRGQAGAGLHDSGSPDRGITQMRRRYRARRPRTDEYLGLFETREQARAAVRAAEQGEA